MTDALTEILRDVPPARSDGLLPVIRRAAADSGKCVVVLDDDPTGTQTVYDTPVLTTWDVPALAAELGSDHGMFYLLTNSRALPEHEAVELAREIGANLRAASSKVGRDFTVVSRSDSTLRGHYPAEVDAIAEAVGRENAIHVIMPFFLQGGRLTIDGTHYVYDGEGLVPAAETPFARDATFGFRNSNLVDWVIEKRGGDFDRAKIHTVSLRDLRTVDLSELGKRLHALEPGSVVVVNAVEIADAHAFALAARHAEQLGADLIYRTAASFVQAYAGLDQKPILRSDEVIESKHQAGLVVVGSYVPKTTAQLNRLLESPGAPEAVVMEVSKLLGEDSGDHVDQTIQKVNDLLGAGKGVVLYTSRDLITGTDGESSLRIGTVVSRAVVQAVRGVTEPLRFLIAKGGITSSDVATKALEAKRAMVLGQVYPGIPVWSLGPESCRPELPYVVFPGNVGDDDALAEVYDKLSVSSG